MAGTVAPSPHHAKEKGGGPKPAACVSLRSDDQKRICSAAVQVRGGP
ncbi:hypothetical protein MBEBAB_2783 [Brevundimonas abyssalis TAR-001]|uniref:Uncharacterized protein n=1 Tax=Brevundimonas abyssalis TAR-001 TaxID=1391729 RepID=A0A8E0TSC0_9CAUL|nr:hypothetical protein MBEBAB_2783 [Brevundimonas abyssalis TAR-001]